MSRKIISLKATHTARHSPGLFIYWISEAMFNRVKPIDFIDFVPEPQ